MNKCHCIKRDLPVGMKETRRMWSRYLIDNVTFIGYVMRDMLVGRCIPESAYYRPARKKTERVGEQVGRKPITM
jgi:hypothetical protein